MTFTHNEKKILASKIENITNKKDYKEIFKIIYENNCNYINNDNGVYINLNILSDDILIKIKNFLDIIDNNKNIIPTPKEYIPYNSDDNSSDMKLSMQEILPKMVLCLMNMQQFLHCMQKMNSITTL